MNCRKELGQAWSAYLGVLMDTKLDDMEVSVLEYVLSTDPALKERFREVLA